MEKNNIENQIQSLLKAVQGGRLLSKSQRSGYHKALNERMRRIKKINEESGATPCLDQEYTCGTCLSQTGESHPVTGYCWHCDTDNWEPKKGII